MHVIVERFAACSDYLHVQLPVSPTDVVIRRLETEADELWSFVASKKANKPWLCIAMHAKTRQVIAFHVGDQHRERAKEFWATMPLVYREQATWHMEQNAAYQGMIPQVQHKPITKKARKDLINWYD